MKMYTYKNSKTGEVLTVEEGSSLSFLIVRLSEWVVVSSQFSNPGEPELLKG